MPGDASPRILHVSGDYPDAVDPAKTPVIHTLLQLTGKAFDHRVISINRRSPRALAFVGSTLSGRGRPRLVVERTCSGEPESWIYRAPARGLYHHTMLEQLGDTIAASMSHDPPDLFVGHKLTIEGIAVARAAERLGRPYALTLQGGTDTKIVQARPDLRSLLRRMYHGARMVVAFAPWTVEAVENRLGRRQGATHIIPCPTENDAIREPDPSGQDVISVFHLHGYRNKNLASLVEAARINRESGTDIPMAVIGGGAAEDVAAVRRFIGDARAITMEGALARDDMGPRMNRAACLAVPSHSESFGLVFVEALLAGCPVIYPRDRAIAGYFDNAPFAVAVDPGDAGALAHAIRDMAARQSTIKESLARWQRSADAMRFTRPAIGRAYADALYAALGDGECA